MIDEDKFKEVCLSFAEMIQRLERIVEVEADFEVTLDKIELHVKCTSP